MPGLGSADPLSDAIHLEDFTEQGVRMSGSDGGLPEVQIFSDGGRGRSVGARSPKQGFLSIQPTIPRPILRSAPNCAQLDIFYSPAWEKPIGTRIGQKNLDNALVFSK